MTLAVPNSLSELVDDESVIARPGDRSRPLPRPLGIPLSPGRPLLVCSPVDRIAGLRLDLNSREWRIVWESELKNSTGRI
jgi:hypothetical protein